MGNAEGLAIYAAVVGTAGLGWQIISWTLDRRTRLDVEVSIGFIPGGPDVVFVTVVNRSRHTIKVEEVNLLLQDGSGRKLVMTAPPPGSTIPGPVQAQDSGSTYFLRDELQGIDVHEPVTAAVRTPTGAFKSRPTTLLRR